MAAEAGPADLVLLGRPARIFLGVIVSATFNQIGSAYLGPVLIAHAGEDVTFRPRGAAARSIKAIINRDQPEEAGGSRIATLEVANDATTGISLAELDRGDDQIELAMEHPDATATRHKIVGYADVVGGMVSLEIR